MIELIKQPWHWFISGAAIAAIMFTMLFFGKKFGFSSNFKTICAACLPVKNIPYFNYDWKSQLWNLAFLGGSILGGYIGGHFLSTGAPIELAQATLQDLKSLGIAAPIGIQPPELFSLDVLFTLKGFLILAIGGIV